MSPKIYEITYSLYTTFEQLNARVSATSQDKSANMLVQYLSNSFGRIIDLSPMDIMITQIRETSGETKEEGILEPRISGIDSRFFGIL